MAPLNCCSSDASKRKCATPKPLANVFSYNVLFTRSWYRSAVCLYPNATRATYTINDTLAIKSSANADGELHRSSNLWLTRNAKSPANVARSSRTVSINRNESFLLGNTTFRSGSGIFVYVWSCKPLSSWSVPDWL